MDNHSKEEDTTKRPDLFAIYEDLNENFVDLTFKVFEGSQTSQAKSKKKQQIKLIQKPSFDFCDGLGVFNNSLPHTTLVKEKQEGKLNGEANKLNEDAIMPNEEGKLDREANKLNEEAIKLNEEGKLDGNLNHTKGISANQEINLNEETKLNGDLGHISKGISPKQGLWNLLNVKVDREKRTKRGMRSPSARQIGEKENGLRSLIKRDYSLKTTRSPTLMGDVLGGKIKSPSNVKHGAHANGDHKLVASNDVLTTTPPRSSPYTWPPRLVHCTFCEKFTLFFRIRCLECKKRFCSKCAKRCVNEKKKCKGCSLEHTNCRSIAFYREKEIAELTRSGHINMVQKQGSKKWARVRGASAMNSTPKGSPWTPPRGASTRRHSLIIPPKTHLPSE